MTLMHFEHAVLLCHAPAVGRDHHKSDFIVESVQAGVGNSQQPQTPNASFVNFCHLTECCEKNAFLFTTYIR